MRWFIHGFSRYTFIHITNNRENNLLLKFFDPIQDRIFLVLSLLTIRYKKKKKEKYI